LLTQKKLRRSVLPFDPSIPPLVVAAGFLSPLEDRVVNALCGQDDFLLTRGPPLHFPKNSVEVPIFIFSSPPFLAQGENLESNVPVPLIFLLSLYPPLFPPLGLDPVHLFAVFPTPRRAATPIVQGSFLVPIEGAV